jgi:predicted nuclease with RNAse H fold
MGSGTTWAGVDVGGRRKGFHLAVLDAQLHVTLEQVRSAEDCMGIFRSVDPSVVAIDSPCEWADAGELSRGCERAFTRANLCGIRYTPNEQLANARVDRYLEWIVLGLTLWERLRATNARVIECFPTASWTAWLGRRQPRTRAVWTRSGIDQLGRHVSGLDAVGNQDQRDAVAAALTARQWDLRRATVRCFGELVVPQQGTMADAFCRQPPENESM